MKFRRLLRSAAAGSVLLTALGFGLWESAHAERPGLWVQRSGENLMIRSNFTGTTDIVLLLGSGLNRQVNFAGAMIVDSAWPVDQEPPRDCVISANGDETAPWLINGGYLGGNHGFDGVCEVVAPGHALEPADLGREWVDGNGRHFWLLRIISDRILWFLGENAGTAPDWKFHTELSGPVLMSLDGKRSVRVHGSKAAQLRPGSRILRQEFFADGVTPLRNGKITFCRFLEVAEEYEIINPGAVLDDIRAHPGQERSFLAPHLAAVLRLNLRYRFFPNGSCVIDTRASALQPFRLGLAGFIMAARLSSQRPGDFHELYIPRTKPFVLAGARYDFQSIQNFDADPPEPVAFRSDGPCVADPGNPPDRFIQFLTRMQNGKPVRDVGFALGYSLISGITRPESRTALTSSAGNLHTSGKMYPYAMDGRSGSVSAGTEFHCVAYRCYFPAGAHPGATCVYWYPDEGGCVLYADFHGGIPRLRIPLAAGLTGRKLTVIEKTSSVTCLTGPGVPVNALEVAVEGRYGSIAVKLE